MSIKISGVIITYNEEINIARCIDSLQGLVDEVVVVDSYSTDKTKEIALNKGAVFIENKFKGHIEQKNFALSQCNSDYVISLDADEAISQRLKAEILEVKNSWNHDGYSMPRLSNYCGKWIRHSGWYPDKKIRLFDKTKGSWGGINPHDKVIMQDVNKVGNLKGDILHYTMNSIEDHIKQLNSFTSIGAKAAYEKGTRSNIFIIIFSPVLKFFKSYFFQRGFLDGYYGFIICCISSFASFIKYVKIREYQKGSLKK
ncbi:MAG: glycosyltransferase family 2 protein [Bacteroidota bacterium]|nr:glycosyltransferase family 2 protein [Bacteroidota bacterium]